MAYVPVPKDLTKVKSKFAFNLTKRQILFFGLAVVIGLPLFFLLKGATGTTVAAFAMILVMLPCFLFVCMRKTVCRLKRYSESHTDKILRPGKKEPYKTQNFYAVIERQRNLEKEVSAIVNGTKSETEKHKSYPKP